MLRDILRVTLLLLLGFDVFAQSNSASMLALKKRVADIKAKSDLHEENVNLLLSRPKIVQTKITMPKLPEPKVFKPIQLRNVSSTPTPPIPEYFETIKLDSNDTGETAPPPSLNDLVVDPGQRINGEIDTNTTAASDEQLVDAYDELYMPNIPNRHQGYYFGTLFGFAFPNDGAVRKTTSKDNFESETGYILGFQYGRDFGNIKSEAEYNYLSFGGTNGCEVSSHDLLARLIFEFELGERADFRTGIGMGFAFIDFDQVSSYSGVGFAYDFLLGGGYRLNDEWSFNLDYRYFLTAAGDEYDRIESHLLLLSATYDL